MASHGPGDSQQSCGPGLVAFPFPASSGAPLSLNPRFPSPSGLWPPPASVSSHLPSSRPGALPPPCPSTCLKSAWSSRLSLLVISSRKQQSSAECSKGWTFRKISIDSITSASTEHSRMKKSKLRVVVITVVESRFPQGRGNLKRSPRPPTYLLIRHNCGASTLNQTLCYTYYLDYLNSYSNPRFI